MTGTTRRPRSVRAATGYLAAAALAMCGGGLLVGLESPFVPASVRPVVGLVLLGAAARTGARAWWRARRGPSPSRR